MSRRDSPFHLAFAGNLGTGKTTLAELIGARWGWDVYLESVPHQLFRNYFAARSRWAMPVSLHMANSLFSAHRGIVQGRRPACQDRTMYEQHAVFDPVMLANGELSASQFRRLRLLNTKLQEMLPRPDLTVWVRSSTQTILRRLELRGRVFERDVDPSWLEALESRYSDWAEAYPAPLLELSTEYLDLVKSVPDQELVLAKLSNRIQALSGPASASNIIA